jgi:hypothetical protein
MRYIPFILSGKNSPPLRDVPLSTTHLAGTGGSAARCPWTVTDFATGNCLPQAPPLHWILALKLRGGNREPCSGQGNPPPRGPLVLSAACSQEWSRISSRLDTGCSLEGIGRSDLGSLKAAGCFLSPLSIEPRFRGPIMRQVISRRNVRSICLAVIPQIAGGKIDESDSPLMEHDRNQAR